MPGGISPEGRLVLTRRTLAVHLVLHHRYAVELGAAPERRGVRGNQGSKFINEQKMIGDDVLSYAND